MLSYCRSSSMFVVQSLSSRFITMSAMPSSSIIKDQYKPFCNTITGLSLSQGKIVVYFATEVCTTDHG